MSIQPEVTILILNWNGKKLLETYLPSVCKTDYSNLKIVVADNGSTDDSIGFLQSSFPKVERLILNENYGYTGGYNRAVQQVNSQYMVLMNNDIRVDSKWLQPIIEYMEQNPEVAIAQPKILAEKMPDSFEYAGACGGYVDALGYPFCRGRIFDTCETDTEQYDSNAFISWASGACMVVRKSAVEGIVLFEELFFAHMEEIDLCWRLANRGFLLAVVPESKVWHLGGATLSNASSKKTMLNIRNSLFVLIRNLPLSQIIWKVFIRLALDGIFGIKLLTEGKFKHFVAVLEAHVHFYYYLPLMISKRNQINKGNKIKSIPEKGFYSSSIVWAYFGKGKKKFSQLDIIP